MSSSRSAVAVLVACVALGACSGGGGNAGAGGGGSEETAKRALNYVSLGDSYSAGGGLAGGTRPCGRAPGASPALVAQRAGAVVSEHACNGATTADVLDVEQAPGVGHQIDAVTADTDVVTISIGGND